MDSGVESSDPVRRLTSDRVYYTIQNMSKPTRASRSFTIDRAILEYLQRTRSNRSRSERANELLRRGILQEQNEALEKEAAEFYASIGKTERNEVGAFARASRRSLTRQGE